MGINNTTKRFKTSQLINYIMFNIFKDESATLFIVGNCVHLTDVGVCL